MMPLALCQQKTPKDVTMGTFCGRILGLLRQTTVEPVMFMYMAAAFLEHPVLQDLIYVKTCLEKFPNSTYMCNNLNNSTLNITEERNAVQKDASTWIMYNSIVYNFPSIITVTLLLGSLGDRLGRKFPLALAVLGSLLMSVCNIIVSMDEEASLKYLLVGRLVHGMCGGFIGMLMAVFSYIGHVSSAKNRTSRIGITESMVFLSGTIGLLLSGIILDNTSFGFVFSLVCGIQTVALLYTIFALENLKPALKETTPSKGSYAKLFCMDSWTCVSKRRPSKVVLYLSLEIFVTFILMLCTAGEVDILLLYTKLQFDWSQTTYGLFKAGESLCRGLSVLTLIPLFRHQFNIKDTTLALMGLMFKAAGLLCLGLAWKSWQMYVVGVVSALQGFCGAGIRSSMSGMVENNEQGRLFALVASAESIAGLVATLLFNNLYSATLELFPGFSFLLAAGFICIGFLIVLYLHCCQGEIDIRSRDNKSVHEVEERETLLDE